MTETIGIAAISTLAGCVCVYLWTKQHRLETKSAETIPLLNERESQLEETLKQKKAKDELKEKMREVEAQKVALEEEKALLRDERSEQQVLRDELTVRSKATEERSEKLKDDIQQFNEKVEIIEKEIKSKTEELESREKEVESKSEKLESREKDVESKVAKIAEDLRAIEKREAELGKGTRLLEVQRGEQNALKESHEKRAEQLESREAALEKAEAELEAKAKDEKDKVEATVIENNAQEPSVAEEEEPSSIKAEGEEEKPKPSGEQQEPDQSDAEKRKKMIEAELERLVKQTNETELSEEEPVDEDSLEALKKAAMKICYLKQFYDVMKDEFIWFPSVAKTAIDYRLMEEAEKNYFEEEDEYPADISGGLRAVAFAIISEEEDGDMDEEYMSALAQDIEI